MEALFWSLALVGHVALWVELVNRLHGLGWRRSLIDALTMACGAALVAAPAAGLWVFYLSGRSASEPAPLLLQAYAWLAIGALAVVVASRVMLVCDPHRDKRTRLSLRETVDLAGRVGAREVCAAGVDRLATLPGNELLKLSVEHRDTPIDRLPHELDGLRVAHLTDLHMSGRLTQRYFEEVASLVADWSPDLVLLTGDIVENTPRLEWVEPTLGPLALAGGAYFVLGNHDEKVDSGELRRRLAAAGWRDAGRAAYSVELRGHAVTVCGDERPWFPAAEPPPERDALRLALVHTPDRFAWACRSGVDLALAGHNHGGQVCFPLIGPLLCPSRHGVRYAAGTFRVGGTVMHVGRGTGSLFPIRWNCPPELSLITLRRGSGR
ncbi:metallophosphoesterase [Botrimarina sp.]|uniref:metallophosphoesterase n=1 Tax=Botrimarina sp. TaxID=2795802 RepID=UPI0032F097FA